MAMYPKEFIDFMQKWEDNEHCDMSEQYEDYYKVWEDGYVKGAAYQRELEQEAREYVRRKVR